MSDVSRPYVEIAPERVICASHGEHLGARGATMKASRSATAIRLELLRDASYFANELLTRLEALNKREPSPTVSASWRQAASITRRIRSFARHQADEQRRKTKAAA